MNPPDYQQAMNQMIQTTVGLRSAEIAHYVAGETRNIVQSGPFAGMVLGESISWGTGNIAPKLLGVYEQELHPAIEKAISRQPDRAVNVGAAEGYYGVGLARRLPEAMVLTFDTDATSREVCIRAAQLNGVGIVTCIEPFSDFYLLNNTRNLIVMDVEGAEVELLGNQLGGHMMSERLRSCDMIIECHDFITPNATDTLIERFKGTHDIETIFEGPRDPNVIPLLQPMCSLDRWLAIAEHRPCRMNWLACWSKDR